MLSLVLASLLLAPDAPRAGRILETPHYTVTITELCSEYEVGCGKVRYQSVSRSGKRITLMGEQVMAMCKDGTTPCHPVGYRFRNHGVTYMVSESGELQVTQGTKTIVDENGTWKGE